jgi:hypothetical protein
MPKHVNTHEGIDPYHRFTDDPCERKHGGNIDSRAAWERVSSQRRETYEKILAFFYASTNPLSPKEVCQRMGKHPSDLSGRFTELKEMGILHPIDDTFEGSRRLELVSRMKPSPLAEMVELAQAVDQSKVTDNDKRGAIHGTACARPCCRTAELLEDF